MVSMPAPPSSPPIGDFAAGPKARKKNATPSHAHRRWITTIHRREAKTWLGSKLRRAPDVQAIFFRRRHQPRRPPLANIKPGSPVPTWGMGTSPSPGEPPSGWPHTLLDSQTTTAGLPGPDVGKRWPSRLVATAEESCLNIRYGCTRRLRQRAVAEQSRFRKICPQGRRCCLGGELGFPHPAKVVVSVRNGLIWCPAQRPDCNSLMSSFMACVMLCTGLRWQ